VVPENLTVLDYVYIHNKELLAKQRLESELNQSSLGDDSSEESSEEEEEEGEEEEEVKSKDKDGGKRVKLTSDKYKSQEYRSLCCLNRQNCFRRGVTRVYHSKLFDVVILTVVVSNIMTMCIPYRADMTEGSLYVVDILQQIFNGIFVIEILIKIVSQGLILHEGSFLRSTWNVLDVALVAVFYVGMTFTSLRFLKIFQVSRLVTQVRETGPVIILCVQTSPPNFIFMPCSNPG
jgi:hypothetical protein